MVEDPDPHLVPSRSRVAADLRGLRESMGKTLIGNLMMSSFGAKRI